MEEVSHNCEECAWKKRVVLEEIDKEDVDVYEMIMTGTNTAKAARSQPLKGEGISTENMTAYYGAVMEKEAHYKKLEIEWWRNMLKKYKISDFTKIDVIKRQFYVCESPDGKEKIEFEPKNKPDSPNPPLPFPLPIE
jgi:hypothetical protein